jgi:hypothetical protein
MREKSQESKKTDRLKTNLTHELDFDLAHLEKIKDSLNDTIQKVSADDRNLFFSPRYASFQRVFAAAALVEGLLYDTLDEVDIGLLDDIMTRMSQSTDTYVTTLIDAWSKGQVDKTFVVSVLSFERDAIKRFLLGLSQIRAKIAVPTRRESAKRA